MSFVIKVVIVPMIWGWTSFGILPFENFAPLSPYRCLRSFSSSLRSRVIIIVFFKHIVVELPGGGGYRRGILIIPRPAPKVSVWVTDQCLLHRFPRPRPTSIHTPPYGSVDAVHIWVDRAVNDFPLAIP